MRFWQRRLRCPHFSCGLALKQRLEIVIKDCAVPKSFCFDGDFTIFRQYMLESSDPVAWTPDPNRQTNLLGADSPDVKYDATSNRFVVTWVFNMFTASSSLTREYSSDGLTWGPIQTMIPAGTFPQYTHNAGVASHEAGHILPSKALVGFGAPYNLASVNSLGNWDLYGVVVDSQ